MVIRKTLHPSHDFNFTGICDILFQLIFGPEVAFIVFLLPLSSL